MSTIQHGLIEKVRGSFQVGEDLGKGLVKVYADDTTVFIGLDNNPKKLNECLDIFFQARFND
jgi:hypothetical protein